MAVNRRVVDSPSVLTCRLKVAKANHRIRRIRSRLQNAFSGAFGKPQKEFYISENVFPFVLHPRNCEILQPHFRLLLSPKRPVRTWSVGVVGILGNDRTVPVQWFSDTFGFSLDAVKHWEGGRRTPESSARAFLTVIAKNPGAVIEALHPHVQRNRRVLDHRSLNN
jgi:hypothetical protein